jgi:hypothetical protein
MLQQSTAGSTVRNIVSTSITVHRPLRRLAQQLTLRDLWLLSIFTIGIKPLPCRQFLQTALYVQTGTAPRSQLW